MNERDTSITALSDRELVQKVLMTSPNMTKLEHELALRLEHLLYKIGREEITEYQQSRRGS